MSLDPFYTVQKIELTYPAAAEAVSRVIIDNDICDMAVTEATRKILAALGINP
jgi:hypothetical protein